MTGTEIDLDLLLTRLRDRGERVTTARRVVLAEILRAEGQHLPVDELAERVHAENPAIHVSTIYRTLDFLTGAGLLAHVHLGHGPSSYHLAGDAHHHAVCRCCGRIIELPPDVVAPLADRLSVDYGFDASPDHLSIDGTCRNCRS